MFRCNKSWITQTGFNASQIQAFVSVGAKNTQCAFLTKPLLMSIGIIANLKFLSAMPGQDPKNPPLH
uniref:Uncharacterized protein n=1 Tax=Rhizophora mucronata TaxID=61149 RepID=A0A2P2II21_RHIMU